MHASSEMDPRLRLLKVIVGKKALSITNVFLIPRSKETMREKRIIVIHVHEFPYLQYSQHSKETVP